MTEPSNATRAQGLVQFFATEGKTVDAKLACKWIIKYRASAVVQAVMRTRQRRDINRLFKAVATDRQFRFAPLKNNKE